MFSAFANMDNNEKENQPKVENLDGSVLSLRKNIFKENNFIDAPSEHTSSKNIEEDVGNVEYNYNLTLTKTMLLDGTQDKKKLRNGKCVSIKDSPKSKRIKKYVDKREQLDNYWNQIIKQKSPVIVENKEEKCYVSPRKIETKKEFDISDDIRCETDNDLQMANDEVYNQSKKPKFKEIDLVENDIKMQKKKDVDIPQKCEYCCQKLVESEIKLYQGHPNGAVEEFIALTDPRLSLFTGEEAVIHESDERPQNKLTYFSVYDKNGHLCSFDSGLIEKNVVLYFSGYMKAIYEDDASPDGGVPTKDMGPINEWWISGFDGGELALIGFNTPFAEYILMEPSEAYATFMDSVREKIYMSKIVIEFLLDEINPTYEDLLNKLQTMVPPKGLTKFTEDALLRHAQFICDQVISFDSSGRPEDSLLITNACMRALVSLAGITVGKRIAMRKVQQKHHKIKKQNWTKATTTKLVNYMFETFFTDQLAKDSEKDVGGPRRHRCGVCEACQQSDCGTCLACKDMTKFRGSGKSKQACFRRRCPNMAIQEADDSDPEEDEQTETFVENTKITQKMILKAFKHVEKEITWIGEPIINDGRRTFYTTVRLIDEEIKPQNYVLIESSDPSVPLQIAKVMYMWEDKSGAKMCHANWFRRGSDTVLGETSDPLELFALDECDNVPFTSIKCKATVVYKKTPTNWADMGNIDMLSENEIKDDGKTFFYQKRYTSETARFEDIAPDIACTKKEIKHRFCSACVRFTALQCYYTPKIFEFIEEKSSKEVIYGMIKYKGEEFRVGSAVFLSPNAVKFKYTSTFHTVTKSKKGKVDEDMYPEYYRKSSDHVKGSNHDTPEPFHVGYINAIYATTNNKLVAASDIWIKVNKMYRPENTHKGLTLMHQVDLNTLYWSNEVCNVRFSEVAGKCYLAYSENLDQSVQEWSAAGPHRFYFSQVYNVSEKTFDEPPYNATNIGKYGKGKGKGKGKKLESNETKKPIDTPVNYSGIPDRLKMLDLFAGCGGLSEGLHQAGIAESKWAIEKEEAAAYAYRLNYPTAIVFSEDCNVLLRKVLNDEVCDDNGQHLPQKGEVELLCGGPPCQGFSGMNRFNSRQYSLFKNSLVVSCLSWCDYYRPKFFIMENVRNFVSFKKSMVLKLTLRCLVRMGYQCTFGILQAGNYGIPQTRRRLIILAAAPGEMLPKYPEPTHVFSKRACHLSVIVDNKKYSSNCDWVDSAPFRTICVRDAMSDLPNIRNGWNKEEMSYGDEPISHFQRMMRRNERDSILRDHICKDMAPLVEARIAHIPTASGSDWRDLPNIVVRMSDGTYTKKLEYTHHDKKVGRSSTGAYRGVCACCAGKVCDPIDRQYNTLIPWCLPHTANRHNHWAGLYGRLEWDGFFGTTITNPEPMGKQGRVLHPEQTRVVSIRECARSQGFPDCFRFYGNILDKHRQVGNAVPPPLGAAIGYEIRKCLKKEDVTTLQIKCEEVN